MSSTLRVRYLGGYVRSFIDRRSFLIRRRTSGRYNHQGSRDYFPFAGGTMGRVREHIRVNGRKCWTLFDTGARNTYVVPAVAALLNTTKLPNPLPALPPWVGEGWGGGLGGHIKKATKGAWLNAEVQGHKLFTNAMVIDEIGTDEEGKPIEILFGALAMQQWGIRPVPDEERLDLTHYPKEFVEF
jgi:hypothetical protein